MPLKITTRLIKEEAQRRGWSVDVLDEDNASLLTLRIPGVSEPVKMWSDVSDLSSAVGHIIAENKLATLLIAQKHDVPVPEFTMFTTQEAAEAFLAQHQKIVVKPIDTNHGDGITTDIETPDALKVAIDKAYTFSWSVMLQRQYFGQDHRVLVVGDKVVAAATRRPPRVEGDGTRTIQQLIEEKNQDPLRGEGHNAPLTLINLDEVGQFLGAQRLSEVLPVGQSVAILGTANLSRGGEAIDVTDQLNPALATLAVTLAKEADLGVCGVDFLVTDCSLPLEQSDAVLLEINVGPGLRMHHYPSQGTSRNVAGAILDEILAKKSISKNT